MEQNKSGFEYHDGKDLITTSDVSALSHASVVLGSITIPVPGVPGLSLILQQGEALNLDQDIQDALYRRAKAWLIETHKKGKVRRAKPEPEILPEPIEPETADDGAGE